MDVGYSLICEEHAPRDLLANASRAERAGFDFLAVSDHFHPWLDSQGQSPFAWSVLGAMTQRVSLPLASLVTCPIKRYHPAIVAQMAATTACLTPAGFTLGLGSGENLNEHIVGGAWPDPSVRLEQLGEAVEIIRALFSGDQVTWYGDWFTVDRARLYTLPDRPPRIALAAGGTDAARVAGELRTGLVVVGPQTDVIEAYGDAGGSGPVMAQASVCWDEDPQRARKIVHERWRQGALDWNVNAELPTPEGFASATESVPEEAATGTKPLGNDVDAYLSSLERFREANVDRVSIHNIGPDQHGFLAWAQGDLLPELRRRREQVM